MQPSFSSLVLVGRHPRFLGDFAGFGKHLRDLFAPSIEAALGERSDQRMSTECLGRITPNMKAARDSNRAAFDPIDNDMLFDAMASVAGTKIIPGNADTGEIGTLPNTSEIGRFVT
jgi:hypothetical protein